MSHYLSKEKKKSGWERIKAARMCCLSNRCIGVALFFVFIFFGIAVAVIFVARDFIGETDNVSTVPNIQSTRSLAWDGNENPRDRSLLLAQMKRLGADNNNIFISGTCLCLSRLTPCLHLYRRYAYVTRSRRARHCTGCWPTRTSPYRDNKIRC